MCGIFGFITKEHGKGNQDRRRFIENGLIAGTVRGDDGAGCIIVPHHMKQGAGADWVKIPTDGYSLVTTKAYQDRLGGAGQTNQYRAVIGHNRAATAGSAKLENTHPFQEGPITLVHNGTLSSTMGLDVGFSDLKKEGVEVDSHVITHNLALNEDPATVIAKLEGAFVLVWHDARDNSVNIVRNNARPIHLMSAGCEDTVLFASEAEMLYWLAKRNNFVTTEIFYPKPGSLLKFLPGSIVPEVREVPLYAPPVAVPAPRSQSAWSPGGRQSSRQHSDSTQTQSGTLRLPKVAQDALATLSLTGESRLKFTPSQVIPLDGTPMAIILGMVKLPDRQDPINARVVGLSYNGIKDALSARETWTINPVMVTKLDPETPFLHAKLLHRTWHGTPDGKPDVKSDGNSGQKGKLPRQGNVGSSEWLPGPRDEYYPLVDWLRHTSDGCIQCGMEINAEDANDVLWVEGQSRPICPGCKLDNIGFGMLTH